MIKISVLSVFLSVLYFESAFALDKNNKEIIYVEVKSQSLPISQKNMYDFVYDEKKQAMFDIAMVMLGDLGIKPEYFVDDYKKSADCYAEKFAENMTVDDFKIIYSNKTSEITKKAIIDNLSNKFQTECLKKYHPYSTGKFEDFLDEYFKRRCDPNKNDEEKVEKCLADLTGDMERRFVNK